MSQVGPTSAGPDGDGLTDVVAELSFAAPITLADLAAFEASCAGCFEARRIAVVRRLLARNRMRAVLLLRAPDAESVRLACRTADAAIDRIWACLESG